MINDDIEVQDTDLDETVEETVEESQDEPIEDEKGLDYWKAEALKNKAILDRNKAKEGTQKQTKTDGFGYDVKAYLKSSGIQSNEFDFVQAELKQSGVKDIDTLLENDYFKSRLENHRELAKTTEAIPSGKRSGGVATDSVEYWMAKPIEEVPQEMRIKVVNARLKKEESRGVFYNS